LVDKLEHIDTLKGKNADNKVKVQAQDSPSAKIVNTETKLSGI